MIAPNSVSYAVFLLCASDALLTTSGGLLTPANPFNVGWHGPLLDNPAQCPWLQVHNVKHSAAPFLVGAASRSWKNRYDILVYHQDASWLANSGDAFKRVWDAEYYLTHSVFAISSNYSLPLLTAGQPGLNLILEDVQSELWNVDQVNEQTLVTNLMTLRYSGQG
jgi:hypothetical protein